MATQVDATGWTGDGRFTPLVVEALRAIPELVYVKVEDAPASRADVGYNLIANDIYVRFSTETRRVRCRWFGCVPGTRRVVVDSMGLDGLATRLSAAEDVGEPDYTDTGMLQYLRTERIVPPYQTRGIKVIELVRIYRAGSLA